MKVIVKVLSLFTCIVMSNFGYASSISPNIIFSESFESPVVNVTNYPLFNGDWVNFGTGTPGFMAGSNAPVGASFTGDSGIEWSIPIGNVDLVVDDHLTAAEGVQSLNLNGFEQGAIEASINFPAIGNYTLIFALSKNPTGVDVAKLSVTLDSVELLDSPYSYDSSNSAGDMAYRYISVNFSVASAGLHSLRFTSLNEGSGFGPMIDDISISRNIIFSESFESPVVNVTNYPLFNGDWVNFGTGTPGFMAGSNAPVGASFTGDSGIEWSIPIGNVDLVVDDHLTAAEGVQSLNLNGFEQGAIEASINFPAIGNYTLIFALSKNPTGVDVAKLSVTLDSVELLDSPYSYDSSNSAGDMAYRYISVNFSVASAGLHSLRFASLNEGSGFGPMIDSMIIARPASYSLLDSDSDLIINFFDTFPLDSTESVDTDSMVLVTMQTRMMMVMVS